MKTVLIAGGTGLIGNHLSSYLHAKGYKVHLLSRKKHENPRYPTFIWDISKSFIEEAALNKVDCIINLAGANIGDKAWSKKRKKEILNSRVRSGQLLFEEVKRANLPLKVFISASAIGYYGLITNEKIYSEEDKPAADFLGTVCRKWEEATHVFSTNNIRTVQLRTGIVLTPKAGALEKIAQPIKLGFGAVLGTGKQYMPWIHIEDLCRLYSYALENEKLQGAYNSVAPNHITNKDFTKALAKQLKKRIWLPNIPGFILKLLLGEMADLVLFGSRVSSEKIIKTGFQFKYKELPKALQDLVVGS